MITVNNVHYTAHGLQRGGNHAVIGWVLYHFKSSIFYNCCSLQGRQIFVQEQDLIKKGELPHEVTLASFEDVPENIKEVEETLKGARSILILRDFYNTYASRFEKKRRVKSNYWLEKKWKFYDDTNKWKVLARQFLEKNEFIKINYNMWFSNEEYRKLISTNFGKFDDSGFKHVSHFGGGSSFDNMNYNGKANEMNVLKRWTHYYCDKEYVSKIIGDEEAKEMNDLIFGFSLPRLHL